MELRMVQFLILVKVCLHHQILVQEQMHHLHLHQEIYLVHQMDHLQVIWPVDQTDHLQVWKADQMPPLQVWKADQMDLLQVWKVDQMDLLQAQTWMVMECLHHLQVAKQDLCQLQCLQAAKESLGQPHLPPKWDQIRWDLTVLLQAQTWMVMECLHHLQVVKQDLCLRQCLQAAKVTV
jgi:hypothetical protein